MTDHPSGLFTSNEIDMVLLRALQARLQEDDATAHQLEIFLMRMGVDDSSWQWYVYHLLACARRYAKDALKLTALNELLMVAETLALNTPEVLLDVYATGAYAACIQNDTDQTLTFFLGTALILDQHPDITQNAKQYALRHISEVRKHLNG